MPSTYNRIEMHEIEEMFLVLNIYKIYKKMGLVGWKFLASCLKTESVLYVLSTFVCAHIDMVQKSHSLKYVKDLGRKIQSCHLQMR